MVTRVQRSWRQGRFFCALSKRAQAGPVGFWSIEGWTFPLFILNDSISWPGQPTEKAMSDAKGEKRHETADR